MTSIAPTQPARFTDSTASVLLDLVRGLAAVLVLTEHWRNLLFVDYPQLHIHTIAAHLAAQVFYGMTAAGHQAVVIFFVLSGYLISGSIFRLLKNERWTWAQYLLQRLSRLWVVLLPGLLLCALWDGIGLHSQMAPALYHGLSGDHVVDNAQLSLTGKAFVCNLLFLQPMFSRVFGTDGPLWSLPFEFWYYVMFPLALLALRRQGELRARVLCGASVLALGWWLPRGIVLLFPVWLLGTVLCVVKPPRCSAAVRWVVGLAYVPAVLADAKFHRLPDLANDYLLAVLTTAVLWVLLSAQAKTQEHKAWVRGSRGLSRFSYTLYVVHLPLVVLLTARVEGSGRWYPTLQHDLIAAAILLAVLVYAWGIAWLTEFRTEAVRSWLERHWLGRPHRSNAHDIALAASGRSQDVQ
jgi:peptidoglycan/LPS O-acetylase OafA/YrhL